MKLFYWQTQKSLGGRFIFVLAKDRTEAINHIIKEFQYQYRINNPPSSFDNEIMGLNMEITEIDLSKQNDPLSFFITPHFDYKWNEKKREEYVDEYLVMRTTMKRGI